MTNGLFITLDLVFCCDVCESDFCIALILVQEHEHLGRKCTSMLLRLVGLQQTYLTNLLFIAKAEAATP